MAERNKRKSLVALALLALLAVGAAIIVVVRSGGSGESASGTGSASSAAAPAATPAPAATETTAQTPEPTPTETETAAAEPAPTPESGSGATASPSHRSSLASSGRSSSRRSHSTTGESSKGTGTESSANEATTAANTEAPSEPAASDTSEAEAVAPPETPTGTLKLRFRNSASGSFRLVRLTCVVDGDTVATRNNPAIPSGAIATVYSGKVDAGGHKIGILAEYQGNGGMFSYFAGYLFKVRSARAITVAPDKASTVVATAFERGGPTVAFQDRLALNVSVH